MRKSGLKKALVLGLTVAMALGTMVTGNAAGKTWKFSFNNNDFDAAVAKDWTQCLDAYDAAKGYGLDEAVGWGAGITTKTASTSTSLNGAMIGLETDGVDAGLINAISRGVSAAKGDTDVSFFIDLPAGTYDVTVYAGGVSCNEVYDYNKIYINGEQIVRDYQTDPWNSDAKSGKATLLTVDDLKWTKTVTLTEATKLEIKASNPSVENGTWFTDTKTCGGRAYLNAVVIEEVTASASTDNVPKTGVVSTAAICGLVALAGAGVAVVSRKKED